MLLCQHRLTHSPHKPVPGLFGCWISPELDGLGGKFHGPEGSQPLQCVLRILGELQCKCCSPSAFPHHPAMPCQHLPSRFAHYNISDQKVPMKSKVSLIHAINMSSLSRAVGFSMSAPTRKGCCDCGRCWARGLTGLCLWLQLDFTVPLQRGNRGWKSAFMVRVSGADGWEGKLPGTHLLPSCITAVSLITAQSASALRHS